MKKIGFILMALVMLTTFFSCSKDPEDLSLIN